MLEHIKLPRLVFHLLALMQACSFCKNEQDIDFVEYCCGKRAVTSAFTARGLRAVGFDVLQHPIFEDFVSGMGFLTALQWLRRVKHAGAIWLGTVCSSWVWMCRHTSMQTFHYPRGTARNIAVSIGNHMVARTAVLIAICHARSIVFILEQPRNSMMAEHPSLCWLRQRLRRIGMSWYCVDSYMAAFGGETLKPHRFYSSHTLIAELARSHPGGMDSSTKQVAVKYIDKQGKRRCSGGKDLKGTQEYTPFFRHLRR